MAAAFPTTRRSVIRNVASEDGRLRREAWNLMVAAYWMPARKYVRLKWRASEHDAEDLVQAFFARAVEKEFFGDYDSGRSSFRTYLRMCLDRFIANERKAAGRLKRGGGVEFVYDAQPAGGESPEDVFHREWVRQLFTLAVDRLRAECAGRGKQTQFAVFERYDLEGGERPTYAQVAAEVGITVTDATNYLAAMRRRLRQMVLEELRNLTGSEREFRQEARAVLGL